MRELENIRNFLTSNAVTVVIGLFFTIVFFPVMYFYSPMLTLIVALTIPVYVAISVFITPPLRARLGEKFKRGAVLATRSDLLTISPVFLAWSKCRKTRWPKTFK
ncbi:ABC transporter transmembrane domain-containing protein [Erythrobacter sp. SAORIC-644]|uniref:ABC transporter transmembrane domain-containing protein n=1 Tax=Erythrobacter sp. SAORIC-644 TaxID=1869314 RepID=UPI00351977B7